MNNRGGQSQQNYQRKIDGMYTANPNQFTHQAVSVSNPGYLIGGQRAPARHYANPTPHNVSEMKNNHMPNMTHGQLQMVPTHMSQRQSVYVPNSLYQGNTNHAAFYPFNPQQASQTVIMPYYHASQAAGMYYSTPRPIQMTNIQQASQNPPVANMSNAQNSHGPSLIVQSQPIEMTTNAQPLQVPQQPATAPMQPSEPKPRRKNAAIKIINPDTGAEVVVTNTSQPPPSADELEKMKVQSQFQSQVQSVVKKDDTKASDGNQNNEGGEKVRSEFQSQVKKLIGDVPLIASTSLEEDEAQLPAEEPLTISSPSIKDEDISQVTTVTAVTTPSIKEVSAVKNDSHVSPTINTIETNENKNEIVQPQINEVQPQTNEAQSRTNETQSSRTNETQSSRTNEVQSSRTNEKQLSRSNETPSRTNETQSSRNNELQPSRTNDAQSSRTNEAQSSRTNEVQCRANEVQSQTIDTTKSEETMTKKIVDEESSKPAKSKKKKEKKKRNSVKDHENITNTVVIPPPNIEPVEPVPNTQDNKENENDNHNSKSEEEEVIQKPAEEISPSSQEIQNNGVQHEVVNDAAAPAAVPKLPSYLNNLPYEEGQWSTSNPAGRKVYSKEFLVKLGSEAVCQKKPDVLRNWGNITKLLNSPQFGSLGGMVPNLPRSQSASATGFMPSYFKAGNSQRGMPLMQPGAKRNSSQGKTASKTAKPNTIHMSLSLREEVKLNQTENAWVPTAAKKNIKSADAVKSNEEMTNEDVYKTVRSILNKITPDNMEPLTERFKGLPINSYDRLEKTIDLVFEKAIEEQSFAPLYASLCSAMQTVQVEAREGKKTASFKKLIISKCQSLFELDKAQEMDSAKKLAEINACKDPDKKKELQLEYEENERRLRKRSVGNCRFIGELFKQKILTPNIMLYCIMILVTKHVEEPLECLCNLLKTVGKELDQAFNLNDTFDKLRALTSKEMKSKIPSRIRFMIQDVIDLRRDKWIPRRNDSKPKLINEIEKDAKNEAMEQSMARESYRPEKPRDHHRNDDNKFRGGDGKSRRGNENEWNVVQNTKFKQQNYIIDQSKLQGFKESSSVTTLGPSSKWSFSNSSGGGKSSTFTSNNTFAALNDDKKSSTTSQMMSSKNTSRKPVISESEERQRMISGVQNMMPQFAQTTLNTNASSQVTKESVEEPVVELDPEIAHKINLQCKNIVQEYEQMHNLDDIIYSLVEDEKSLIRERHEDFVRIMSLIALDSKPNTRTVAGKMFVELLSKKVLTMTAITKGIDAVLKDWNDYLMDYPQFFSYIAAIITPLLISKTASFKFNNLKDACSSIRPNNSNIFFIEVLQKILSSKETQNIKEHVGGILWIYNKWRSSEYVPLDAFMPTSMVNKHFKNDRVGVFLLSVALYDKMKLTEGKLMFDNMFNWINTNINSEIIKCPLFVRALTIAIVILCLKPNHSFEDFFEYVHIKLMTCFIRSEPLTVSEIQAREVECLYGIQLMSATLEHPGGMVLKLFHKLYQDSVISKESFEKWKKEEEFKSGFDEDLETKTMAVVVLNSFFLSLDSNDSDDEDTADQ